MSATTVLNIPAHSRVPAGTVEKIAPRGTHQAYIRQDMVEAARVLIQPADHLLRRHLQLEHAEAIMRHVMVSKALEMTRGNRCRAARLLGVHRNTLSRILVEGETLGLPLPRPK